MPHFAKFHGINFRESGLLNIFVGLIFAILTLLRYGTLKFHASNDRSAKICPATIKFLNCVRKICSFKENRDNAQHFCLRKVL